MLSLPKHLYRIVVATFELLRHVRCFGKLSMTNVF